MATRLLIYLAVFCMMLALLCSNITMATNDYTVVLTLAFLFMMVADVCCVLLYRRGFHRLAPMLAAPSLFIIADFLERLARVYLR